MPRFADNLSMLYPELGFADRFEAAARDGFTAVECQFPYDHAPSELAARLRAHGLQQVRINCPAGDWAGGDRGLACHPGREAEFRDGIDQALRYAEALACPRVHVMAGLVPAGQPGETLRATYVANLRPAARAAARQGVDVLIEPINPRDMPGFFLSRQADAHALLADIGEPNARVQMDLYHCQIVEGDVAMKLRHYLPTGRVGHLQIAGVPERHEPDVGELNHAYLFRVIDEVAQACGWDGWVGCEYRPARGAVPHGTRDGLGWRDALTLGRAGRP
jgi:2-dehydrotetronate isomerase